jgi:hypothetical protein
MTTPLGPDLAHILPKPWLQRLAPAEPTFRAALTTPRPPREDFLVDVRPPPAADDAATPGFGLAQATAVTARVQRWLRVEPARGSLHRIDGERSAGLLAHVERQAEPAWLLAQGAAASAPAGTAPVVGASSSPP